MYTNRLAVTIRRDSRYCPALIHCLVCVRSVLQLVQNGDTISKTRNWLRGRVPWEEVFECCDLLDWA